MIFYDFEYERPDSLEQAVALLNELQEDVRLLAGGTDLLPNMRLEALKPTRLVSLGKIDPEPPRVEADGSIRIDALSRLSTLERSELLSLEVPMLAESARVVGSNQTRKMGTLGGNLCQENRCLYLNQNHDYQFVAPCYKIGGDCCYPFPNSATDVCRSVYMSDIAPALIALDAEIEILGKDGARRIPAEELYTGVGMNPITLGRLEIIRSIIIPPAHEGFGWGFHKSTVRGGLEFAMVVFAIALRLERDGATCADARIVLGAIREGPVRPLETEQALVGATLDADALAQAADQASREIRPLQHHGYTISYLKKNIEIYLRRTLGKAVARTRHGGS